VVSVKETFKDKGIESLPQTQIFKPLYR